MVGVREDKRREGIGKEREGKRGRGTEGDSRSVAPASFSS